MIGSMHNMLVMLFWLQDLLLSWSIPYLKPSTQMFLYPWLLCTGICPHKTTCPISHTGIRTSWCLGTEDYWFHPGEHVFIIKTADPSGLWNKENRKKTLFRIHNRKYLHVCPGEFDLNIWYIIPEKTPTPPPPKKPQPKKTNQPNPH